MILTPGHNSLGIRDKESSNCDLCWNFLLQASASLDSLQKNYLLEYYYKQTIFNFSFVEVYKSYDQEGLKRYDQEGLKGCNKCCAVPLSFALFTCTHRLNEQTLNSRRSIEKDRSSSSSYI
jgi:hypothetical protein